MKKASFLERFVAHLIDIFLVSFAAVLLSYPFLDFKSIEKLDDSYTEVVEKALNDEIDIKVFTSESARVAYQLGAKQGITSILTLVIIVLYFVVYQFYNDGQTIGKKIMKIKVVSSNENRLTMDNYIYRSMIINSLLINILIFILLLIGNDMIYFVGVGCLRFIDYLLIIISVIMIISSKNKRGLQDIIANTDVVKI